MTVDELQNFIENNLFVTVDNETYNKLMSDAQSMDLRSFVDKYDEFLSENSEGWNTFSKDKPKYLAERIANSFGSSSDKNPFIRSANEIEEIYKRDFEDDVSREAFYKTLSNMANYWDAETKTRDYEAGKRIREKEVKHWPFYKNLLTSEYGKERYINEPEKSVWGDGPYWNKGDDVRDMILGGTAAFSELIPGWGGALAGPAIRGTRDILNYNKPYSKEWSDIVKDIGFDLFTNVGIQKLPNFRREKRMTSGVGGENVNKQLDLQNKIYTQKQILDSSPTPTELENMTDSQIFAWVNNLPECELKTKLSKGATSIQNIDRPLIITELDLASKAIDVAEDEGIQKATKDLANRGYTVLPDISKEPIAKEALTYPKLTKFEKRIAMPIAKGTRFILNDYGDQAMRIGTDVGLFPGKKSSPVEGPNINYTRDFLLGFVPDENSPDYIKKQFEKWREDYYKKYKVYPEEDTMARTWEE